MFTLTPPPSLTLPTPPSFTSFPLPPPPPLLPPSSPSPPTYPHIYTGNFPAVTVHTVLPSGPNSLQVSWMIPESACLQFTSFSVQCISSSNHQNTVRARTGALEANVSGLNLNTLYSCQVTSNLADWQGTPLNHQTISNAVQNYTYPAREFPGVLLGSLPKLLTLTLTETPTSDNSGIVQEPVSLTNGRGTRSI